MQNNHPLDKVVFIQIVAAFANTYYSLKDLFRLAYVNNSWNDTIKNYSFHLFEQMIVHDVGSVSTDELEDVCNSVIKSDVIWFVNVLLSSKALLNRISVLRLVCKNESTSLDMTRLVVEKIMEAGGKDLLKGHLTASGDWGRTCLMLGCANSSSASPELVNLILEKIFETGGIELLKSELCATRDRSGRNCLMLNCRESSSAEVLKLILEKIVEVGGVGLLKSQLEATDIRGSNCLMLGCYSPSPEAMKFAAACMYHLDIFKRQYTKIDVFHETRLRQMTEITDDSWTPDAETTAEVKKMLLKC